MQIFCHKVLPAVFDDSLSYYEQVCSLVSKVNEVIDFNNSINDRINEINEHLSKHDGDIESLNSELAELTATVESNYREVLGYIAELKEMIERLGESQLQWDCQHGYYTNTMQAQRDMFNDVTAHGITCDDLAEAVDSVDALANCGLNVRGVAVIGLWLVENFDIPEYFKYREAPEPTGNITVLDLQNGKINPDGFFVQGDN